jgi:hypothetical protein
MPIQSCVQSVGARHGKLYTEIGLWKHLNLKFDSLLSTFAFTSMLRRYITENDVVIFGDQGVLLAGRGLHSFTLSST